MVTLEPPHAEERGRKDPVELVARALCNRNRPAPATGDAWDNLLTWIELESRTGASFSACERDRFVADAHAALAALGPHGYLDLSYYDWRREQQTPREPVPPVVGGNSGHGHVWPRPDGMKARCGGPALCAECAQDQARLDAARRRREQQKDETR